MTDDADNATRHARRVLDAAAPSGRLSGPRLRCGQDPGPLIDQVAEGRSGDYDGHQRECVFCQAALAEYARLWRPVLAVTAHDPPAPQAAVDAALQRLRGVTDDPDYGHLDDPQGRVRVSSRAVASLAAELTRSVRGVRVALGRVVDVAAGEPTDDPFPGFAAGSARVGVIAGVMGGSAAVQIVLAAEYGTDLPSLGERVRQAVAVGVRDYLGLDPVYIDVVVDDVLR